MQVLDCNLQSSTRVTRVSRHGPITSLLYQSHSRLGVVPNGEPLQHVLTDVMPFLLPNQQCQST